MPPAIVVVASTVSVFVLAQTPPATRPQPSPPPAGTVTVTGCLRAATEPGTFVLEQVEWNEPRTTKDASAHHAPELPKPTTPELSAARPPVLLRLAGSAERLKMRDHVGHTVTVTGMLAPSDPIVRPGVVLPDPQPTGDTTSREREREARAQTGPTVLNVRSLTSVAAKCLR